MLGEEALKQGIYEAYEMASNKLRQYDRLNFLYSLQHNKPKIEKIMKLANKSNNIVLAYNAALFLGAQEEQENILRDCGLEALAEMAHQTRTGDVSQRLRALGVGELNPIEPEGELDFSNWPHNVIEEE